MDKFLKLSQLALTLLTLLGLVIGAALFLPEAGEQKAVEEAQKVQVLMSEKVDHIKDDMSGVKENTKEIKASVQMVKGEVRAVQVQQARMEERIGAIQAQQARLSGQVQAFNKRMERSEDCCQDLRAIFPADVR